ncbi:TIGR04283 family arsenosugar biosynthesis glycosyltransferase [Hymenobacter koreensis]|uniref:TIGR04283 family arsenosugar biosynthesis glycosyltransferase n=1 Tax=Hymenobacter koreensis TaxID=1084523 RepID=A0ABP8IU23_9BACT
MLTADSISIIIPTYQEAACIGQLVEYLQQAGAAENGVEIIVADAPGTDATAAVAAAAGARVIQCTERGRAAQMNHGAAQAQGQLLYFLHADTLPPKRFLTTIRAALRPGGYGSGCFRLQFDHPHWFLRLSAWFTRFPAEIVRFGDQSLFVRREVFEQAGGFRPDMVILEDQEIIARLRRHGRFVVLPEAVVTSARKYLDNGVFRLQGIFLLLCVLYRLGLGQTQLRQTYRTLVRQDKI